MKDITFTVPCYNSEDYMEHCIDTLLSADERAEIIIVDDGSTDRTGEIADNYARNYPEIVRVVHQENGGHGAGVNAGLRWRPENILKSWTQTTGLMKRSCRNF